MEKLIGWLPSEECPRTPGRWHVGQVRMSVWPPQDITARIGLPPETEVSLCGCVYGGA